MQMGFGGSDGLCDCTTPPVCFHMLNHAFERLWLPFREQHDGQILYYFEARIIRQKAAARNLLRSSSMNGIGQFDRELGANLGGRD